MYCFILISKYVYIKSDTLNNISIASFIILIINPYSIYNLGFQLSVTGTLGIVLFYDIIFKKYKMLVSVDIKNKTIDFIVKKIEKIIVVSISANIMMLPILAYNYNTVSFGFIISSVLIAPILGIMCVSGYLMIVASLFSIGFAKIFAFIFNYSIKLFYLIAQITSRISFTSILIATPNIVIIILYYVLIFYLFFFYKKQHFKFLIKSIIFILCIIFINNSFKNINYGLRLYFIDVGQGDSSLIVTETNKKLLIDGGGSETGNYDVGENVLVPYLLDRGVCSIDYMIFSHFDSDHCKGLFTVMEKLKVKNAVVSEQGENSYNYQLFLELANKKDINIIRVRARR